VFVYGTLKPGFSNFRNLRINCRVEGIKKATVKGTLHSLGAFPGMVRGDSIVHGYILYFDDKELMEDLDYLEGYASSNNILMNLYTREFIEAFDYSGKSLGKVQTYIINTVTGRFKDLELIESGNWV